MNTNTPIIISGMHRSGTSLLTKILMDNGVFMGSKLDTNLESVFFQRINKWILSCAGSSWDNPKSLKDFNNDDINIIIDRLDKVLANRLSKSLFFGKNNLLYNKSFNKIDTKWGWKDPANTFTIPIWLKIFPNSKIINITRHPLDVSLSLFNREYHLKKKDKKSLFPIFLSSLLPLLSISKGDVLSSFNITSIDDCLSIYKKYYKEMESNSNDINNILEITYENLILKTEQVLDEISIYLDIPFNRKTIENILRYINKDSVYKFKNKKLLYNKFLLDEIDYVEG